MSLEIKSNDESFDTIDSKFNNIELNNDNKKKKKEFKSKINKSNKFLSTLFKYRKIIIISGFALFVLLLLPISYLIEYNVTKVNVFSGDSYTSLKSVSKIKDFDFDFYCSQYGEPDDLNESKALIFTYKVSNFIEDNYNIKSLTIKVAIGDKHWTKNYYSGNSYTILSDPNTSSSKTSTYTYLSSYEYSYPESKWLFVKINHPTVWVLLSYTKQKAGSSSTTISYKLSYSYNEWYRSGSTVII